MVQTTRQQSTLESIRDYYNTRKQHRRNSLTAEEVIQRLENLEMPETQLGMQVINGMKTHVLPEIKVQESEMATTPPRKRKSFLE